MAIIRIFALAKKVEHLKVLKKKLERDYGAIFTDGPMPDREGQGYKMYFTLELEVPNNAKK